MLTILILGSSAGGYASAGYSNDDDTAVYRTMNLVMPLVGQDRSGGSSFPQDTSTSMNFDMDRLISNFGDQHPVFGFGSFGDSTNMISSNSGFLFPHFIGSDVTMNMNNMNIPRYLNAAGNFLVGGTSGFPSGYPGGFAVAGGSPEAYFDHVRSVSSSNWNSYLSEPAGSSGGGGQGSSGSGGDGGSSGSGEADGKGGKEGKGGSSGSGKAGAGSALKPSKTGKSKIEEGTKSEKTGDSTSTSVEEKKRRGRSRNNSSGKSAGNRKRNRRTKGRGENKPKNRSRCTPRGEQIRKNKKLGNYWEKKVTDAQKANGKTVNGQQVRLYPVNKQGKFILDPKTKKPIYTIADNLRYHKDTKTYRWQEFKASATADLTKRQIFAQNHLKSGGSLKIMQNHPSAQELMNAGAPDTISAKTTGTKRLEVIRPKSEIRSVSKDSGPVKSEYTMETHHRGKRAMQNATASSSATTAAQKTTQQKAKTALFSDAAKKVGAETGKAATAKAAKKLGTRVAVRFLPIVGWVYTAYEVVEVGRYGYEMYKQKSDPYYSEPAY